MQSNQWRNIEELYHNWKRNCCSVFILAEPKDPKRRERAVGGGVTGRKKYLHCRVMEVKGSRFPFAVFTFQLCPLSKTSVMSISSIWSWILNNVFGCLLCGVLVFQALKHLQDVRALHNIKEGMKKTKKTWNKHWFVLFWLLLWSIEDWKQCLLQAMELLKWSRFYFIFYFPPSRFSNWVG